VDSEGRVLLLGARRSDRAGGSGRSVVHDPIAKSSRDPACHSRAARAVPALRALPSATRLATGAPWLCGPPATGVLFRGGGPKAPVDQRIATLVPAARPAGRSRHGRSSRP
jgi:hypothetical protein